MGADAESGDVFAVKPKRFTDLLCFILFAAYLAGMGWIAAYGLKNGDLRKLVAGIDYDGNMCGIDTKVADRAFLYWCPDPTKEVVNSVPKGLNMNQPICVASCPDSTTAVTMCPQPAEVTVTTSSDTMITVFKTTLSKLNTYVTTPVGTMYCLPNLTSTGLVEADFMKSQVLQGDPFSNPYVQLDESMGGLAQARYLLIGIVCVGISLSWLYLWFLSKLAKELVYGTIAMVVLSASAAGALFFLTAYDIGGLQEHNPLYSRLSSNDAGIYSQIAGSVLVLLALLVLVVLCCLHDTLDRVVGCIEAACEALAEMPALWVQPIFAALLKGFVLLVVLTGLLYVMSVGDVVHDKIDIGGVVLGGLGRSFEFNEDEKKMVIFYGFGLLWVMETCNAIQTFVVSYAVMLWFAVPMPKEEIVWFPVLRGFFTCIVFHLGSMACGAFLMATTRVVSLVLWFVAKHADSQGNAAGACLAKCCMACVECFRRCLEYINKNAYCDIAIESNDFFFAAKKSCQFMKANATDILLLHGACWFGQFSGVLLVTSAGAGLTYLATTQVDRWSRAESEFFIADPLVVCAVAGAICATISAMFLTLFDDVADTMLYCYALARERGVAHRYAPVTLRALAAKYEPEKEAEPLVKEEEEAQTRSWFFF